MQLLLSLLLTYLATSTYSVLSLPTDLSFLGPPAASSNANVRHHPSNTLTERDPPVKHKPVCANAPTIVAGTVTPAHLPSSRTSLPFLTTTTGNNNKPPIPWCAPSASIYIIITTLLPWPSPSVSRDATTTTAIHSLLDQILRATRQRRATTPLDRGDYLQLSGGATFIVHEVVGQTLTYGVLGVAVTALQDFMGGDGYRGLGFQVWDGAREFGEGFVMGVVEGR
ncbi:hypothetical protein MMC14_007490 [Varicellaria rhodocarpa]|nr:hypothetical protein [Varicellaria rhodocarpa]